MSLLGHMFAYSAIEAMLNPGVLVKTVSANDTRDLRNAANITKNDKYLQFLFLCKAGTPVATLTAAAKFVANLTSDQMLVFIKDVKKPESDDKRTTIVLDILAQHAAMHKATENSVRAEVLRTETARRADTETPVQTIAKKNYLATVQGKQFAALFSADTPQMVPTADMRGIATGLHTLSDDELVKAAMSRVSDAEINNILSELQKDDTTDTELIRNLISAGTHEGKLTREIFSVFIRHLLLHCADPKQVYIKSAMFQFPLIYHPVLLIRAMLNHAKEYKPHVSGNYAMLMVSLTADNCIKK